MSSASPSVGEGETPVRPGPEPEPEPAPPAEPSPDELFHVLRNQRRRFVLHHLKRTEEPVDVGDLATQVAAWENEVGRDEVTSQQRRRVYNALQQTHIDELDDTGLVDVDRREVSLSADAADLDIYFEVVAGRDVPWSEYYLALGAVGTAALAAAWLDVGPLGLLPDAALGAFLAAALLVSACANYYRQRRNRVGGTEKPPELREDP